MGETMKCELCGEPMPQGEEMFKFHGYSGPCPAPPLPRKPSEVEQLRAELAAARAEVERLTKERDEYRSAVQRAMQETREWRERLEWTRDAVQAIDAMLADAKRPNAIEHGVGPVDGVRQLQADLAAVRKVEEWIQRGNDPLKPEHAIAGVVNRRYGAFVRCEAEETTVATGKSLIALGRALAAQEGTDAT